jgi:hypothetical protein
MALIKLSKPVLMVPVLILLVLLAVDLMQVTRASSLSAIGCTNALISGRPDWQKIVVRYNDAIAMQAAVYDLPAELLAAVIVNHQRYLSSFRAFTDCFGSALGADLSLGLAQVRISTAAWIDGAPLQDLAASEYRELRARLLAPASNIAYEARELRALLEQENRYPGMNAETLIHDPFVMALLVTEYRMGRLSTASASSRLSANAFNALRLIQDGTVDRFGRDANDTLRIRTGIREYLHNIYCESGIFNEGVCQEWQRSLAEAA